MNTRTKIICTIGPAVNTVEKMISLIQAGMNVARINFSHGSHEEHEISIRYLKEARAKMGVPLAIMLDTKGPEIRIGKIKNNHLELKEGDRWLLIKETVEGDDQRVTVQPGSVLGQIGVGTQILFNDGYISSHVIAVSEAGVLVEINHGGVISSNKGVNVPNTELDLPALTDKDIADITFGVQQGIDVIAASFVRSANHVLSIKRLLDEQNASDVLIIAKIENHEGVNNFDSILQVADGVMIARGDLGVELPISQVPRLQKMMIRKCYLAGKPAVTATQMLESMIHHPRPTRAEASDVANAIYDSTSSIMLSGETAVGKYPVQTVDIMRRIVQEAEGDFNYQAFFEEHSKLIYHDVPSAVTLATVKTAYSSNAKAIFAFTNGGSTARLISRLRPGMPIIAMTPREKTFHQLALNWGVIPFLSKEEKTIHQAFEKICSFSLEQGYVSYGDLVVVTAGSPFGISGTTNMMIVESIGDVPVRGHQGVGQKIYGNVGLFISLEGKQPYAARGQLIVISKCDASYLPFIRESLGVILENHIDDVESERFALKIAGEMNKPFIVRADGALRNLKEGQLVTMDPDKALIYKGVVL